MASACDGVTTPFSEAANATLHLTHGTKPDRFGQVEGPNSQSPFTFKGQAEIASVDKHSIENSHENPNRFKISTEAPLEPSGQGFLREGCRESRRCSRDTYPEAYIAKHTRIRRVRTTSKPDGPKGWEWNKCETGRVWVCFH